VNPVYSIMESPHRWLILSGIAFLAGCFGAIEMLALVWPHVLARIWLLAFLVLTAYFLIRAFIQWKNELLAQAAPAAERTVRTADEARRGSAAAVQEETARQNRD
jgi:ABC-type transport system involved in cytochrome bd biosynthesis fused ATPase/permease subunit